MLRILSVLTVVALLGAVIADYRKKYCKSDILLIVDTSTSQHENKLTEIKLAKSLIDELNIYPDGHRVALLVFAGKQKRHRFDFGKITSNDEFKAAFQFAEDRPLNQVGTNINGAMRVMKDMITNARPERINQATTQQLLVILFSDGIHSDHPHPSYREGNDDQPFRQDLAAEIRTYAGVKDNKIDKVTLLAVSVDPELRSSKREKSYNNLLEFVGNKPSRVLHRATVDDLRLFIAKEIQSDGCPKPPPPTNAPPVRIQIPIKAHCLSDISIVIDSSGSIHNHDLFRNHSIKLLRAVFKDEVHTKFVKKMAETLSLEDITDRIASYRSLKRRTDITGALKRGFDDLIEDSQRSRNNDRLKCPKFLVLYSDARHNTGADLEEFIRNTLRRSTQMVPSGVQVYAFHTRTADSRGIGLLKDLTGTADNIFNEGGGYYRKGHVDLIVAIKEQFLHECYRK